MPDHIVAELGTIKPTTIDSVRVSQVDQGLTIKGISVNRNGTLQATPTDVKNFIQKVVRREGRQNTSELVANLLASRALRRGDFDAETYPAQLHQKGYPDSVVEQVGHMVSREIAVAVQEEAQKVIEEAVNSNIDSQVAHVSGVQAALNSGRERTITQKEERVRSKTEVDQKAQLLKQKISSEEEKLLTSHNQLKLLLGILQMMIL